MRSERSAPPSVAPKIALAPSANRAGALLGQRRDLLALGGQIGPLTIFFAIFLVAPLVTFLLYSFWTTRSFEIVHEWNVDNYAGIVTDGVYWRLLKNTLIIAASATGLAVVVAYAYAHAIRFHLRRWQEPLLLVIVVALFSGYLARIYAWRTILGDNGILNEVLMRIGLIDEPITFLLYNRTAAILVLCNFMIPLAVLPIYAGLQNVRDVEIEAARDLGCGSIRALWRVTLPLALPGILSAFTLCFIVAAGDYVTPQLVGGTTGSMVGRAIADAFGISFDWARGAALSFIILVLVLGVVFGTRRVLTAVVR